MPPLAQLADAASYRPCQWDLKSDAAGRAYWLHLFRWHLDAVLMPLIENQYADATDGRVDGFARAYRAAYDEIEQAPDRFDRIDVLLFTQIRDRVQVEFDIADPFQDVKQSENASALALLPGVLRELDNLSADAELVTLARGLLAGNIFDLGSRATIERHRDGETAFHHTLDTLPPRPWWSDDLDALRSAWHARPPQHVAFFVDNAGSDIVLGCLPLVRWMLRQNVRVTLAANTAPTLNDITADELERLLDTVGPIADVFASARRSGQLRVWATGSRTTLIDLAHLDADFVTAVRDADLLILHGMGRGVESNFDARFSCDVLHTAVLKNEGVAEQLGARLYDCVFRRRAAQS